MWTNTIIKSLALLTIPAKNLKPWWVIVFVQPSNKMNCCFIIFSVLAAIVVYSSLSLMFLFLLRSSEEFKHNAQHLFPGSSELPHMHNPFA
jgi:hypothetical protein